MTKWTLPEGRKPLTDMAALTRRLAGTAVDYKELYEAAKRDGEEAEALLSEAVKAHPKVKALVKASGDLLEAYESGWRDGQDWGAGKRARAALAAIQEAKP